MAIYDCFQYFNEEHIVDLRLNILDKHVDYFVISESTKTHQGKEKKINFDIKKFKKFAHKIIFVIDYRILTMMDYCCFTQNLWTALMIASKNGQVELGSLLIENKAEVHAKSKVKYDL